MIVPTPNKLRCLRCSYTWMPRVEDVRACPKCRSIFWDKPRKVKEVAVIAPVAVPSV